MRQKSCRSASRNNNERLEYLGDSFLSFAIARRLYAARPEDTEGDLSRARAALVREATLAAIGQQLRLDEEIVLGAGELRSGGAQRGAVLADAVEARDIRECFVKAAVFGLLAVAVYHRLTIYIGFNGMTRMRTG